MSHVSVRQAEFADLDALGALFDQYRQFYGRAGDYAAARAFLQARMTQEESVLFIADVDGRAGGFVQLYPAFSSVAMARIFILNDLFVIPAVRRQGVARALLAAAEAHAGHVAASRLTLFTGRENHSAQALYIAAGWQPDQQHHVFHRHLP